MHTKVSIVIGFRNREFERVENCLRAIGKQKAENLELIFVDYGSDYKIATQVKNLVGTFSFAKYIYSDTRGMYWNRAHALNTGIRSAIGEIVLISDIDLILPDDFISNLNNLSFDKKFYTFRCYYLPEDCKPDNITESDLKRSSVNYVGLCAVLRKPLTEIAGFDEYYMNWGGEDDDLYDRLIKFGCQWQKATIADFPVIHQWHPKQSPRNPTPWYLDMVDQLYSRKRKLNFQKKDYGKLISPNSRISLIKIDSYKSYRKIDLFPNSLFQFNIFLDTFFKMNSGECGYFSLPIPPNLPKGRKQNVVERLNSFFIKLKSSYIIVKNDNESQIHNKDLWYDFIMFFVGRNRQYISDYYLMKTTEEHVFFFQKK